MSTFPQTTSMQPLPVAQRLDDSTEQFDPYYQWLGIPPQHQPADHYRLLSLERFEDDPEVIENAADQRMAYLRTFQAGKHSDASQNLLNEVAAARVCLLNAEKRAAYDARLRAVAVRETKPAAALPPIERPSAPPVQRPATPERLDSELSEFFSKVQKQQGTLAETRCRRGRVTTLIAGAVAVLGSSIAAMASGAVHPL